MVRIKVSKEVAKALEYTTYDLGIDVDDILKAHKFSPKIWVTDKQRALRDVDYAVLEQALKKGFEIDMKNDNDPRIMVGVTVCILSGPFKDKVHVIQEIVDFCGKPAFKAFGTHFWLSNEGFLWGRITDNDDVTIKPQDYKLMIDQALATGDKQWFEELVMKVKGAG